MKSGGLRKTTNPHGALPSGRMWTKQFNKALHGGSFFPCWNAKDMKSAWGASIPFCVRPEKSALFALKRWASGTHPKQSRRASFIHNLTVVSWKTRRASNMGGCTAASPVRQDAYKLDQRIRQMEFLSKNRIDTLAQLETHRKALQTEIGQLQTKRKQLPKTDDVQSQHESVNTALKQLRQEERLCRKIAEHSLEVQQHLTEARRDRAEQQQREQEHERARRPNIDLTL